MILDGSKKDLMRGVREWSSPSAVVGPIVQKDGCRGLGAS